MKKTAKTFIVAVLMCSLVLQNIKAMTKITSIAEIPAIQLLPHPETGVLVPEEWRKLEHLQNLYEVSNYGRLKSVRRNGLVKGYINTQGYREAGLMVDKRSFAQKIHRLVCIAFYDNPENKRCVNHIDNNRANNFVFNLEWCTHSENTLHAFKTGNMSMVGVKNSKCILTEAQVLEIRKIKSLPNPPTNVRLAIEYGVSNSAIDFIVKRYSWKHI